ncbi:MAG: c-type cytochrome [Alphaproteobacteria bacterium]|nr:c-type cytochrome [Alphaproteobacteria bacterium]
MRHVLLQAASALALGIVPALGIAPAAADVALGKAAFDRACASCHSVEPGKHGTGPSLAGVLGAKSATAKGFSYSPAMIAADLTWTEATLDAYLATGARSGGGDQLLHGVDMSFRGLAAGDRAALLAYLRSLPSR